MQARYYDPVIGRFYSNDPVGWTPENPVMSFNRYLYVNNNPYKYTDPTGKNPCLAGPWAMGACAVAGLYSLYKTGEAIDEFAEKHRNLKKVHKTLLKRQKKSGKS